MTENKRFTMCHEQNDVNGWTMSIIDWETKEPFNYTTYEVHSNSITDTRDEMEDLCLLLNELNDENKKLKMFLKAVNEELSLANRDCDILEEENEQLKQFKEGVFTWIDKEIARNEEAIGWGKETGADSSAMGFYNHMLKRLKKELSE